MGVEQVRAGECILVWLRVCGHGKTFSTAALRNLLRTCELFARLLTVSFCAGVSSRFTELLHKASGGQDDD